MITNKNLKLIISIFLFFNGAFLLAQGTYYNAVESQVANGLNCMPLKQSLHDLISNHTVRSYADVYDIMCTYDVGAGGIIIDRYKNNTTYTCNGGSLPGALNREHVLPRSWWGGSTTVTQYSDFHNLFPSDAQTNQDKSAYPLGLVSTPLNGNYPYTTFPMTNIGLDGQPCTNINPGTSFDDNTFEPDNGYKGDFARVYLYMAVRYQDEIINQNWKSTNSQTASVFSNDILTIYEPCLLSMLLQWHNQDPPSQLEIDRNNGIALASNQDNRNPFIDHPEYANLIWDSACTTTGGLCSINNLNSCDFTAVQVITNTGTQPTWQCDATTGGSYFINAYTANNNPSEQWLIYGPVDLSNATIANLVLSIDENYSGPDLEFLWNSTSNNPADANWNSVTTAGNTDVTGLSINFAAATGNSMVYIGIKYTATGTSGGTHSFNLYNISFETDNCCSTVNLAINFDNFPGQTNWTITDVNNNVVASGGNYSGQASYSNIIENACLADGCYTLNMQDAVGNGMCPFQSSAVGVSTFITPGTQIIPGSIVGTLSLVVTPGLCGNYSLTDGNGINLISGGGAFGSNQSQTFCLNNGVAPKLLSKENISSLNIYPNPATNFINVDINETFLTNRILITNIEGKVVQEVEIDSVPNLQLNVSNLEKGYYLITAFNSQNSISSQFLKK